MLIESAPPSETAVPIAARARSYSRKFFSFPAAMAALLLVVTVFTARGRLSDPDLWWHLKAGELISRTHSIPRVDTFSFTAAGHSWVAQEWLSELTIYAAYHVGGYSGLIAWLFVFASAVVLGSYFLGTLYSGNVKLGFIGGLITWVFATIGLSIRPHILGFVLLIAELVILELGRKRSARWFYFLPPLFALWINLHSSFIFGFVVLAVRLGCAFLEFESGMIVATVWPSEKRKLLAMTSALSALALLINPIGPRLIWYPLEVMFTQPLNIGFISEWQQPNFASFLGVLLLVTAASVLLVALIRPLSIRIDELLLLGIVFYFAVRHLRMEFLFGIIAAPILCRLLADAWDRYQPERDRVLPNAILMAIAAVAVVLGFPNSHSLVEQVNQANPVKAVDFTRRSGLQGRMLNEYAYGGYLLWTMPEHPVFIDGRADVYEPAGVLADYKRLLQIETDPRPVLNKYQIDFCLFATGEPIVNVLPLVQGWKKVYSDSQAAVFAREK